MFWCTNCQGKCYIDPHLLSLDPSNPSKAQTSFNRISRSKSILDNATSSFMFIIKSNEK